MPSSYDPRPSLLWLADDALDQAAHHISLAMHWRARAGEATDERYQQALEAVIEERARVRLETAILDQLTADRVASGDLDDDP